MSVPARPYKIESLEGNPLRYSFLSSGTSVSSGVSEIVKIVEFEAEEDGSDIYLLTLFDYLPETKAYFDDRSSNNGDMYRVLATVERIIWRFLKKHPGATVKFFGSDSLPEFQTQCSSTCKLEKCKENGCRKAHRRIRWYVREMDSQYESLSERYMMYGSYDLNSSEFEPYKKGEPYMVVVFEQKTLT